MVSSPGRPAEGNVLKVAGSYVFEAPIERIWDLLLDPRSLQHCIPGVQRLDPTGEDVYAVTLAINVIGLRGSYGGQIRVIDREPPRAYTIEVRGEGEADSMRGTARVSLGPDGPQRPVVSVDGEGHTGGALKTGGQLMLSGLAKMLLNQLFQ